MDGKDEDRQRLFDEIVAEHVENLEKYLLSICYDRYAVADALQNVLLRIWEHVYTIEEIRGDCDHYLCSIAKNELKNLYRTKWRHFRGELCENPGESDYAPDDVVQTVIGHETRRELLRLLRHLRREHAETLYLYYFKEWSMGEIADYMGHSYNTVVSWHARGKKKLARLIVALKDEDEDSV